MTDGKPGLTRLLDRLRGLFRRDEPTPWDTCCTLDELRLTLTADRDSPEAQLGLAALAALDDRSTLMPTLPASLERAVERGLRADLARDGLLWVAEEHEVLAAWRMRPALNAARQQLAMAVHADANADVLAGILLIDLRAVPLARWPTDLAEPGHAWIAPCDAAQVAQRVRRAFGGEGVAGVPSVLGLRDAVATLSGRLSPERRADYRREVAQQAARAAAVGPEASPGERRTESAPDDGRTGGGRPDDTVTARERRPTQTITVEAMRPLPPQLEAWLLPFAQTAVRGAAQALGPLRLDALEAALAELAEDRTVALPDQLMRPTRDAPTFRALYQTYVNRDPEATALLTGRSEVWTRELIGRIRARGGFAPHLLGWLWGGMPLVDSVEVGRFYLPVDRQHADAVWCALELELLPALMAAGLAPLFKMGPTLAHFQRSDSCVVYVHREGARQTLDVLADWVGAHREAFRDTAPLFTARVLDAEGAPLPLAFGQSAPMGQSFGELRARLATRAVRHLRRQAARGLTLDRDATLWLIASALERGGVDLDAPAFLRGDPAARGAMARPGRELFADLLPRLALR